MSWQNKLENDTEDDQKIGEDGDNDDEDKNKSFKSMKHTKVFIQVKSFIFPRKICPQHFF